MVVIAMEVEKLLGDLGEIPFEPWKEKYTLCTRILGFSNGPSWLFGLSWLVNMYIFTRG